MKPEGLKWAFSALFFLNLFIAMDLFCLENSSPQEDARVALIGSVVVPFMEKNGIPGMAIAV